MPIINPQIIKYLPLFNKSKGKGHAGKQGVRSQKKGKESANKRARIYDTEIEVEDKGSEFDDHSVDGGESEGEKGEKPRVSLFSYRLDLRY